MYHTPHHTTTQPIIFEIINPIQTTNTYMYLNEMNYLDLLANILTIRIENE